MKLKRRDFLKAVGLGFPALIPASALGMNGAVAPSDRVVVACVGTGWQGGNNVNSMLEEPGAQLVACCDIDAGHLKQALDTVHAKYGNKDCTGYSFYEEVLERKDIDAVVLSVPDHWHGILSVAAARAGKDIYGEKPLAHNFAEGVAIRDAVARYGRVWQTGSWQRSVSQFRLACELVLNGRIGKVRKAEVGLPGGLVDWDNTAKFDTPVPPPPTFAYDRWLGPAPLAPYCPARIHKTWRWNLDYGGGMLMDWIGHHIDIAHWGLGLDHSGPVQVEGTGEFEQVNRVWNAPSKFRVTATYAGGVTMYVSGGYGDVKPGTKWIGDEGWVWVDRSGIDAQPKSLLTSKLRPGELHLYRSPGHHREFLECVKTRRRTLTPADVALRSATPGYLGIISILLGRKIAWDPAKEKIVNDAEAERLLSRPMRSPWRI